MKRLSTRAGAALAVVVVAGACAHVPRTTILTPRPPTRPVVDLPDSSGIPTTALAEATSPTGERWIGTYGRGIFVSTPSGGWRRIVTDTTSTSMSMDFIHAIAFSSRGVAWIGTIGNGWGRSADGGTTWQNWTFAQLGPEWQYVAPNGIVIRGDTVVIATADGLQVSTDDGKHWTAFGDRVGPLAMGPADTAFAVLPHEYLYSVGYDLGRWWLTDPRGLVELDMAACLHRVEAPSARSCVVSRMISGVPIDARATPHPRPSDPAPLVDGSARGWVPWFARPISRVDNPFIDQTYRWGSTMGGFFQPHQGVEFNNPDGTSVHAIGEGTVVYAGRAERGALTVAIHHDRRLVVGTESLHVYSVYYHNSTLRTTAGARVTRGDVIAEVGHTGRATNDHLHLEVHAAPTDSVRAIVDSLNRYPPFTTNPELWITPLPGTGVIAGTVLDGTGTPVPQARVYGITKPLPFETPFVFAETYGPRNRPHPGYGEHFAVSDVPVGKHEAWVMIGGTKVRRTVTVRPGALTWVDFRP